jgi:hypothetical protein
MQQLIAFQQVALPSCDLRELSAASRVILSCLVIVLDDERETEALTISFIRFSTINEIV